MDDDAIMVSVNRKGEVSQSYIAEGDRKNMKRTFTQHEVPPTKKQDGAAFAAVLYDVRNRDEMHKRRRAP